MHAESREVQLVITERVRAGKLLEVEVRKPAEELVGRGENLVEALLVTLIWSEMDFEIDVFDARFCPLRQALRVGSDRDLWEEIARPLAKAASVVSAASTVTR